MIATTTTTNPTVAGNGGTRALWKISAAAAALAAAPALAYATPSFTAPVGVSAYRLVFVTTERYEQTSTDIADYNADVTAAAADNPSLPTTTWSVIGSTSAVSAASNIECGASCDALPIYLVDGTTLVATGTSSLFTGGSTYAIDEDQLGNSDETYVWTGSTAGLAPAVGDELGATQSELGFSFDNNVYGIDTNNGSYSGNGNDDMLPLYAISGEIDADVPEPASGIPLLVGGLIVTRVFRRRKPVARVLH